MQLSFRGAKYSHNPVEVDVIPGQVAGTYRGVPYRVRECRQRLNRHPYKQALTYRGVDYQRG